MRLATIIGFMLLAQAVQPEGIYGNGTAITILATVTMATAADVKEFFS